MRLTKEQFDALAPYEKHFDSAVNHRWTRFPGGAALDLIHDTLKQVTGLNLPLNKCCSHCILELMTDMGKIFLADREERNKTLVSKIETEVEVVKAEVKTKKPRKSRK
jgi:hypothetical protein